MVVHEAPVTLLSDPKLYVNRELSLLEFQRRVFDEARDSANPIIERVKFLSILSSNLDEFFMVRFAGLKQQVASGVVELSIDGRTPAGVLDAIRVEVNRLLDDAYAYWQEHLSASLAEAGVRVMHYSDVSKKQRAFLDNYFRQTVFPVLTPLAFDPGRPFPHISNLSLNLAVVVRTPSGEHFARVKIPDTLPQLVAVSCTHGHSNGHKEECFVWLEDVIEANLTDLFPGLEIVDSHPFHVTRDAEYAVQEIESDDLLETIEEAVWRRRFRALVRLQVKRGMPEQILEILTSNLELDLKDVYRVDGPLDLGRLKELGSVDRPDLKDKPFVPATPPALAEDDLFAAVRREDILLHHPFDSFQPVVEFLRRAASDPDVLAIKMTLYRTGTKSPIVAALLYAAVEHAKQVAVLVELKARFDEESNIEWARALEREGVHVVYGLVGLKVHSKVALIVRREGDMMRRYVHMATGNYNATTARFYTDIGMLTADEEIGADVTDLFNYLTGYSAKTDFRKLLVAPLNLRRRLDEMIAREIDRHQKHGDGHLIFKMNALEDQPMIEALYRASQAGVKIDLLVRGLCCLRPGLKGVSETITVTSVIGRFLEHSRIFYFFNGGKEEVYLGSADLMPRNLSRRVEVVFPVENPKLIRRLRDEILATYIADNVKARREESDGKYVRVHPAENEPAVDSQASLLPKPR
jgi:polyphosphate kinase